MLADSKSYVSNARRVSISASILCIVVYVLVFYIFNLAPSVLFNSTKFWFFLTNTLIIIIIAADYGSFSASSVKVDDLYDEYVIARSHPPTPAINSPATITLLHLKNPHHEAAQVIKKEVDVSTVPAQGSVWDNNLETENVAQPMAKSETNINHADEKKASEFRRTKSEKLATHSAMDMIQRSESDEGEIGSEFEAMTDEELNQRVEEFIQKFNRQIRLERHINFTTQV